MSQISVKPRNPKVGDPYTVSGSGFEPPFVRVSVTYEFRAELYKVAVAVTPTRIPASPGFPGETDEAWAARQEAWNESGFKPGDISITEIAEQPGRAEIVVWDWPQRHQLAKTEINVSGG